MVSVEISDHFVSNWGDSSERTLGVAVKGGDLLTKPLSKHCFHVTLIWNVCISNTSHTVFLDHTSLNLEPGIVERQNCTHTHVNRYISRT